jgi:protein required for attachment to host cells
METTANAGGDMRKTWVLVADSVRARLFTTHTPKGPLHEFEDLVHPESRMHAGELNTDRPGRAFDRMGQARHAVGAVTSPKAQEAEEFARQVAERLEAGRNAGDFEQLVLVAPPDFLGLLRKAISPVTSKLISREVGKNVAQRSAEDIRSLLPEFL